MVLRAALVGLEMALPQLWLVLFTPGFSQVKVVNVKMETV